ncbi:MAG: hypothetical protein IBJ10_08295 [Phycisphaerales bacterium]|nr:hypothetical protein [Phycisphaerales bacterium]
MTDPRPQIALRLFALAAAASAWMGAGCGSSGTDARGEPKRTVAALEAFPASLDLVSPTIRGSENGLEVLWLVAHDDAGCVAEALAPYAAQPVPMSDATREAWRANGLRLVRLPIDDLAALEKSLSLVGMVNRQWMGWALDWREAFRGRSIERGAPIVVDGARRAMPAGALRFIARCWTAPSPNGAVIRLELAAQLFERLETRTRADELRAIAAGESPIGFDAMTEGRVFEALTFEAALEPGFAYVVVGEAPDVDWDAPKAESAGPRIDEDGFIVRAGAEGPSVGAIAGPPALSPPTLGEAMLNVRALGPDERPARALFILVPRTPARFDLFAM